MKSRKQSSLYMLMLTIFALGLLVFIAPVSAKTTIVTSAKWIDDFGISTLGSSWSWIREDPTRWSLSARPGFLRLTTSQTFTSTDNLLVQDAPAEDYQIQTHVFFTPTQNFQLAGLLIYLDDGNYLSLGRAFCDAPAPACMNNAVYFDYVKAGIFTGGNFTTATTVLNEAYLRLVKHGTVFTGFVSTDGSNWTLVGTHTVTIAPTKIGLRATNQITGDAEIPADFDYFTLINFNNHIYLPLNVK